MWFKKKQQDKQVSNVFTFRGIDFKKTGHLRLRELTQLYLVFRALDGDELAKELLDANNTKINDAHGNTIYPPGTE